MKHLKSCKITAGILNMVLDILDIDPELLDVVPDRGAAEHINSPQHPLVSLSLYIYIFIYIYLLLLLLLLLVIIINYCSCCYHYYYCFYFTYTYIHAYIQMFARLPRCFFYT
jgi:hypothetical protein